MHPELIEARYDSVFGQLLFGPVERDELAGEPPQIIHRGLSPPAAFVCPVAEAYHPIPGMPKVVGCFC